MKLMRFKKIYFAISLFFLIPGMISLFLFGLKPAIDFTGGSLLELQFLDQGENSNYSEANFKDSIASLYEANVVQSSGDNKMIVKGKEITNQEKDEIVSQLNQVYGQVEVLRFETVGPVLGAELLKKTLAAVFLVSGIITFYVWKQFDELKYGVCAVLAMLHDSLILIGAFSLLGHFFNVEVDVLFVTALLTTLSFSVHDTIVVYDRIRELKRKHTRFSFEEITSAAVLETLSRSINNSMTIIIMLLSLAILGGDSIRWFVIALLIGAITGTYSSTFTAVPLLLVVGKKKIK
ncbi:MAG: SecF protein [Candidatus Pacebacteria bacterium GW2011_GWF2_38_9]|nr:MAG: protein-export membrane protein SecF, preprotein translocase subunit SecF [candidate division TM6 bacterium GW2011_GWF2_28_16]KKQ10248.1 MAG: SecF protein [Candidatus Pacebacteria bacterium GW2011_GWF1_36_5]KKQ88792.1 MAG: SecF protein [Candidatus Pacebacteria bacterium GW2011_GWF2_38_9]HAZ73268.1 protein translocase subunit SecF [Candidatus Paceibacterota bacterium]